MALSWTASSDNVGVAGYRVYRDATDLGAVAATAYTDTSVAAGATYTYTVKAYDAAGNLGAASNAVTVTVPSSGDTTPPTQPFYPQVTAKTGTTISIQWAASSDDVGVAGYGLYRDGTRVATTTATSYGFTGLSCGRVYELAIDTYDEAGNRSPQTTLRVATHYC